MGKDQKLVIWKIGLLAYNEITLTFLRRDLDVNVPSELLGSP